MKRANHSTKRSTSLITFSPSSWRDIPSHEVSRLTTLQKYHDRVKHKEEIKIKSKTSDSRIGLTTGFNMLSNQPFLQLYDMDTKEVIDTFNDRNLLNHYLAINKIKVAHISHSFTEESFCITEE